MYICERSRFSAWVKAKEGREGEEEDEETDEMEEHLKHTPPPPPPTPKGGRRRERKGEPPPRKEGRIGFNGFHPDSERRRRSHGRKGNVDASNGGADGKRVKKADEM